MLADIQRTSNAAKNDSISARLAEHFPCKKKPFPPPQKHISAAHHTGFPFSVAAKTMRRVLLDYGEDILVRSENSGCFELRSAISQYLKRSSGITVSPGVLYSISQEMFMSNPVFYIYVCPLSCSESIKTVHGKMHKMDGFFSPGKRRKPVDGVSGW